MMEFLLVENLDEVKRNIIQFNRDVKENEEMRRRFFSRFKQWYYVEELDMFAPSKYIGYKDMNAFKYNNKDGFKVNGGKTEAVLKKWFIKKDMPELMEELEERMNSYGKVKKGSEIHILKDGVRKNELDLTQYLNDNYATQNELEKYLKTNKKVDKPSLIDKDKRRVKENLFNSSLIEKIESETLSDTEKEQVVKGRIGQSKFKRDLINIECKCRLCGVSDERFLVASHIKPWSESNNHERLDVNNGLLLCPNHDSLFDKGFISFNEDGTILISMGLDEATKVFLNINETMKVALNGEQQKYMKWHRENIYKSEQLV